MSAQASIWPSNFAEAAEKHWDKKQDIHSVVKASSCGVTHLHTAECSGHCWTEKVGQQGATRGQSVTIHKYYISYTYVFYIYYICVCVKAYYKEC